MMGPVGINESSQNLIGCPLSSGNGKEVMVKGGMGIKEVDVGA